MSAILSMVLDVVPAAAAPAEWWSVRTASYFGAFTGSALGIVGGGLGAAMGVLAPQGKGKSFIVPAMTVLVVACLALLTLGFIAWVTKQPQHVWYFPVLVGSIGSAVMGSLLPIVSLRYRQAEARKLDAAALKRS